MPPAGLGSVNEVGVSPSDAVPVAACPPGVVGAANVTPAVVAVRPVPPLVTSVDVTPVESTASALAPNPVLLAGVICTVGGTR